MYIFKKFLYNKFDSLYIANNFILSIINCYFNIFSNICLNIHLYGDLGIGKTFFMKGLIKGAGGNFLVKSPTYNIYDVYFCEKFYICHFDLYRLNDFNNLNFFENEINLNYNSICIFEWPIESVNFVYTPDFIINIFYVLNKRYIIIKSSSLIGRKILFLLKKLC
ncbi:MAG TPA: tRNA (adenosine(37)-N6)-threonylcarbamoyltransferase complex ATPase subunit type 1 TsaE [Candidatus Azosocius sp. HAIN]